ncbi:MAG: HEPN domain-containing protein [Patescibacteria group bacterium]
MNSKFIKEWIRKAEKDEFALKHLLPLEKAAGHACFLSQQVAEKYLKAYLTANEYLPPKTHQLLVLLDLCVEFSKDFSCLKEEAVFLSDFYIITRYPSERPDPTLEDAEKAFEMARKFKDMVLKKLTL